VEQAGDQRWVVARIAFTGARLATSGVKPGSYLRRPWPATASSRNPAIECQGSGRPRRESAYFASTRCLAARPKSSGPFRAAQGRSMSADRPGSGVVSRAGAGRPLHRAGRCCPRWPRQDRGRPVGHRLEQRRFAHSFGHAGKQRRRRPPARASAGSDTAPASCTRPDSPSPSARGGEAVAPPGLAPSRIRLAPVRRVTAGPGHRGARSRFFCG